MRDGAVAHGATESQRNQVGGEGRGSGWNLWSLIEPGEQLVGCSVLELPGKIWTEDSHVGSPGQQLNP